MIRLRLNDWSGVMNDMARLVWSGNWSVHERGSMEDSWGGNVSSASDGDDAWCNELQEGNFHLEPSTD